jgi:hypothetical protein
VELVRAANTYDRTQVGLFPPYLRVRSVGARFSGMLTKIMHQMSLQLDHPYKEAEQNHCSVVRVFLLRLELRGEYTPSGMAILAHFRVQKVGH